MSPGLYNHLNQSNETANALAKLQARVTFLEKALGQAINIASIQVTGKGDSECVGCKTAGVRSERVPELAEALRSTLTQVEGGEGL